MSFTNHFTQTQARVSQFIDAARQHWLSSPAPQEKPMESAPDVTHLLRQWRAGDQQALEQLTALVYDELRRLAAYYLRRERAGHTLQATALVHEAYLRLMGQQQIDWQNRAHFIAVAARLMRHILVDQARAHTAAKRNPAAQPLPPDQHNAAQRPPDVLALDEALEALGKLDERKSRIIELRYFGGLSIDEIGEVTGLSAATIGRDLRMAEAWLGRHMQKR